MEVRELLTAPGTGSYFCEDIAALHARSIPESDRATTPGVTTGFHFVRQPAETLSVGLRLEDGFVAWGDCVGVSYGGKSGREGLFSAEAAQKLLTAVSWAGRPVSTFRLISEELANSRWPMAIRYGLSQAWLVAIAHQSRFTPMELLCQEWGLKQANSTVPLQGSCGNDRYAGVEKMIFHRLDVLPHSQVDDLSGQFGAKGEVLLDYARWVVAQVRSVPNYLPTLSFDVHGAPGKVFGADEDRMAGFVKELAEITRGFECRLESPLIADSRDAQIAGLKSLRNRCRGTGIKLFADEWANTLSDIQSFLDAKSVDGIHIKMPDLGGLDQSLEAVLACQRAGVDSLLGGSCIETHLASVLSVHVALASRPSALLVKPGLSIHESVSLQRNEMNRTLLR